MRCGARYVSRVRDTRIVLVAACSVALAVSTVMGSTAAQAAVGPHGHAPKAQASRFDVASAELEGVSCPAGTACVAVGWQADAKGVTRALAERWASGRWQIVRSASPASSKLLAVSCTSTKSCQAIGLSVSGLLAERWNGRSWSREPIPNIAGADLGGISCARTSMCLAVGSRRVGAEDRPVSERWNGKKWIRVSTPRPAGGKLSASLDDVSCSGPRNCIAVGSSDSTRLSTLVERWNGKRWRIVTVHAPSGAILNSISCPSARWCTVAGAIQPVNGDSKLLIGDLNKSRWTFMRPTPAKGMLAPFFFKVSCSAPRVCTALVSSITPSGDLVAYSVASRGARGGFVVAEPRDDNVTDVLRDVSCRPVACEVVGGAGTTDGQDDPSGEGTTFAARGKGNQLKSQPMP
jgi:hypothetical protein